uniref:Uncharacterized protein n=1 Tax=Anguilla anguilla TaxID=7936 RepID=A0A0E9V8F1_ANGAN
MTFHVLNKPADSPPLSLALSSSLNSEWKKSPAFAEAKIP